LDDTGKEKELFVPVKAKRRQSSKERLDTATTEALTLVKEAVQNYPTKELISFMKEEMEKSRQHELKLFQLLLSQRSEASFHSIPYSSNEHRYNASLSPHPYYIFSQGNTHNSSIENMGITHEKRSSEPFRQLLQRSIVT